MNKLLEPSIRILPPEPRHLDGLVRLSQEFAKEVDWARGIPIASIDTLEAARARLFGPDVVAARIAEDEHGEVVGYTGVYHYFYQGTEGYEASLLIGAGHRHSGLGRALTEALFACLPPGLRVEAWVLAANAPSLAATPRMGFTLDRVVEDEGREVYVFIRET